MRSQINIRIDKELKRKVQMYCDRNEVTLTDFTLRCWEREMKGGDLTAKHDKELRGWVEGLDEDVGALRDRLNKLQGRFDRLFGS